MEVNSSQTVNMDDIEYTDDLFVTFEGKLFTGQAVDYYKNGQICKTETYKGGRKSGVERSFYADGSIKSEHENIDGGWEGVGRTWFPNGQLKSETRYRRGVVLEEILWAEDGARVK
ncbi:hypothetical protein MXD59_21795 [Frankia sp. Ag45/Mut15]|uniref:MORN variant repeat protein n=1 Tax=Frankia umida TaxID=573489 RepID=A0ABT0K3J6_9ACTN|nr:hypothetical protein [Frankia umida]MCK9878371.1 hypothetical protein [Frankia umida]